MAAVESRGGRIGGIDGTDFAQGPQIPEVASGVTIRPRRRFRRGKRPSYRAMAKTTAEGLSGTQIRVASLVRDELAEFGAGLVLVHHRVRRVVRLGEQVAPRRRGPASRRESLLAASKQDASIMP